MAPFDIMAGFRAALHDPEQARCSPATILWLDRHFVHTQETACKSLDPLPDLLPNVPPFISRVRPGYAFAKLWRRSRVGLLNLNRKISQEHFH